MFLNPDEFDSAEYESFWRALNRGEFKNGEFKRVTKQGKPVWLQAAYVPILDLNGCPFKVVKYATDITEQVTTRMSLEKAQVDLERMVQDLAEERSRVEEQVGEQLFMSEALATARDEAERANREKSRFLAEMSHEFRTPLNAIIGFSEMLTSNHFGPLGHAKYDEYTGYIHDSGHRLLSLVNDLLDLAKIEAGEQELNIADMCLKTVAEDCVAMVGSIASKKRISITVAGSSAMVTADQRAVQQILTNLVSNAIKYSRPDTKIRVTIKPSGDKVAALIQDQGFGIEEEDLAQITNAFTRGGNKSEMDPGGTGLGLAITEALVRALGGELEFESTVGQGTTVSVMLPRAAQADKSAEEPSENLATTCAANMGSPEVNRAETNRAETNWAETNWAETNRAGANRANVQQNEVPPPGLADAGESAERLLHQAGA